MQSGIFRVRHNGIVFMMVLLSIIAGCMPTMAQNKAPEPAVKAPAAAVENDSRKEEEKEDSLWLETLASLEADNATESIRLLRMCVNVGLKPDIAEIHLKAHLASISADISQGKDLKELSDAQINELLKIQQEICALRSGESDDWLLLMQMSDAFKKKDQLVVNGQLLLDRVNTGMPLKVDEQWLRLLQLLEENLRKDEQVLYRLQLTRILSGLEETAAKYSERLEDVKRLAEVKTVKILGLAEVAIAVGELDNARDYLDRVKAYNPKYIGLERLYRRLEVARKIQKLLINAQKALSQQLYDSAIQYCNDVLKIEQNNVFARSFIQQVEEARNRAVGGKSAGTDRVAMAIRRIEIELRRAEKEHDFAQIRSLIKELMMLKSDVGEYARRLDEVEKEIAFSRLYADERYKEAQQMLKEMRYAELRLFLNRNPGLMSSVDRMLDIMEMRLLVNFHTGHLDELALRNAAQDLQKKAGKSFAASFVMMKLELAHNKMDDARRHYLEAKELQPRHPSLRMPGWILWIHGEGRPVVVLALIIVLFLLIKLIRPAFAWFESTYWTRAELLLKVFPSLAMRSLEGCFGSFKDSRDRERLFRMLVRAAIKVKNSAKGARYAENLLDLIPEDDQALEVLVPSWLARTEMSEEKLGLTVAYAARHPDNAEVMEKTALLIKRSKTVQVSQIDFLRIYVGRHHDDIDMLHLIGKSLLEIPPAEMPDSALAMLETAWRKSDSDELWWNYWRFLMFCGKFDQALQITIEVMEKGRPVIPSALLEVFDKEQYADIRHATSKMNVFDEKKIIEAARSILRFKYFNEKMAEEVLRTLESISREDNQDLTLAARESIDHVRRRHKASMSAIAKIEALSNAEIVKKGLVAEPVSEDNASEEIVEGDYVQQDYAQGYGADEAACVVSEDEFADTNDLLQTPDDMADPAPKACFENEYAETEAESEESESEEFDQTEFSGESLYDEESEPVKPEKSFSFEKFHEYNASEEEDDDCLSVGDLLSGISARPTPVEEQKGNDLTEEGPDQGLKQDTGIAMDDVEASGVSEVYQDRPAYEASDIPDSQAIEITQQENTNADAGTFDGIEHDAEKSDAVAPLHNDEEAARISQRRQQLFGGLDSVEAAVAPTEAWLAYCSGASDCGRLFAEIDQG